jgi:uncharacterized membrane protein YsdA (DUF1294 family)
MSATARRHLIGLSIAAVAGLFLLYWLDLRWLVPVWWLLWGAVTFAYYGFDKRQAGRGGWRVPESILHLLAVTGGFLGGWGGMVYFRHKTQKPVFKVVLALATIAWVGGWLWWVAG